MRLDFGDLNRLRRQNMRVLALLAASAHIFATGLGCSSTRSDGHTSLASPSYADSGPPLVVGGGNFLESTILADIYGEALKGEGFKVTYRLNIGNLEVTFPTILTGKVSLMPAYNGYLLSYLNPNATPASPQEASAQLAAYLPPSLGVLDTSSANDTSTVTVNASTAAKCHVSVQSSIADLAPCARKLEMGGRAEFATRHQGLPGLDSIYGVKFKSYKVLDQSGPLTVAALARNAVQAADIFSTDSSISKYKFVPLRDPKGLFTYGNVIPLINKRLVPPGVIPILNSISARLDTETLRQLNAKAAEQGTDARAVARDWLKSVGLPCHGCA